jgi:hypothetical protein
MVLEEAVGYEAEQKCFDRSAGHGKMMTRCFCVGCHAIYDMSVAILKYVLSINYFSNSNLKKRLRFFFQYINLRMHANMLERIFVFEKRHQT